MNKVTVAEKQVFLCRKQQFLLLLLLQNDRICVLFNKIFLTGTETSGLPVTLLPMERKAGGGRT